MSFLTKLMFPIEPWRRA